MKIISNGIASQLGNSSEIRRMFEAGMELKRKFGADNVFDYSIGNPDVPAPAEVKNALTDIANEADKPFAFGYMPNAGFPETRKVLAENISAEQLVDTPASDVIATVGAAGGINVLFRAILEQGDEVLCPAPYFVEYGFYVGNFGGKLKTVPSKPDFSLDIDAFAAAINEKTAAVIINSPNNPTGQIYTAAEIDALCDLLSKASEKYGRAIYLVSDEPYRALNYDGMEIPSLFQRYKYSVIIGSFSKTLSLPGARIGYVAVNPRMEEAEKLMTSLTLCNRILGFVNAPVIAQRVIQRCAHAKVDLDIYRRRRDKLAAALTYARIEFRLPSGAFYFFPKSPTADEKVFLAALLKENVLAVSGTAFGMAGHFRLAFCTVSEDAIVRSAEAFKRAVQAVK